MTNSIAGQGSVTRLAVLGFLAAEPMHGYRILSEMRARRMERWAAIRPGSVYQLLGTLERRGLVRAVTTEKPGNRPKRTVYALTDAGRQALRKLLIEAWVKPAIAADPADVALSFAGMIAGEATADAIGQRTAALDAAIAELEETRAAADLSGRGVGRMIADLFDHSLRRLEVEREWAVQVRRHLEAGLYDPAGKDDDERGDTP